jgi:hypothetical protein
MPERLSLLHFELKSEKVKPPVQAAAAKRGSGSLKNAPERAKTKQEASDEPAKIEPPRYKVLITMKGVAPTDVELANYMTALNACSLLRDVALEYSEQKDIEGRTLREFKVTMTLDSAGDVRRIDPLSMPRVRDPMSENMNITMPAPAPGQATTAPAPSTATGSTTEGH